MHNLYFSNNKNNYFLSSVVVVLSFMILPLYLWLAFLSFISCFSSNNKIVWPLIFALSFLISSRYVGLLWGGSDDMASYFLAYENYKGLDSIVPVTLKYAKNLDFLFAFYTYLVNQISDAHKFIYYFSTVFISLLLYALFLSKYTNGKYVLFGLLLYMLFFKTFQLQWNVIRSSMAIPILFLGISYSLHGKFKKGLFIYVIGALVHGSTALLLLPLFVVGKRLSQPISVKRFLKLVLLGAGAFVFVLAALYFKGSYLWYKIITQQVELNVANIVIFVIALSISLPAVFSKDHVELSNILKYIIIIALAGFIFGKNFYRFAHPFLAFAPVAFIVYISSSKNYGVSAIYKFAYVSFCYFGFLYVLFLNQSQFYYLNGNNGFPGNYNGFQQVSLFLDYIERDIDYYNGYRLQI